MKPATYLGSAPFAVAAYPLFDPPNLFSLRRGAVVSRTLPSGARASTGVIGADGAQLGVLEVDVALNMAVEAGLDLVEVAPLARPPVVRIMDYGKYKFEQAKQARQAKKKQHIIQLKEVKYRPGIEKHDER